MALTIEINGEDRTSYVIGDTIEWKTEKNGIPDSFNCVLENIPNANKPLKGEVVKFKKDATTLFEGKIVNIGMGVESKEITTREIECLDYSKTADSGELIAEIYADKTVDFIINDVITRYPHLSDFTDTNVNCPTTIDHFPVAFKGFTEMLKDLADRVGFLFYIDKDKDIHFFAPGDEVSPYSVTESSGTHNQNSFRVSERGDRIFNWLLVRGGEFNASETTNENFTGDDSTYIFDIEHRYSDTSLTVAGTPQDLGVFGVNDPADYDALYDYQGKRLIFPSGSPPASPDAIVFSGKKKLPIFIQVQDEASIEANGIIPKRIVNSNLATIDSAIQYAFSELGRTAQNAVSGSFITRQETARAGNQIVLSHTALDFSEVFIVQRTTTKVLGDDILETSVEVASFDLIDAIGILARLLTEQVNSGGTETILDIYRKVGEKVGVADGLNIDSGKELIEEDVDIVDTIEHGVNKSITWVLAPYYPSSFSDSKRQFRLDYTPCLS